MNLNPVNFDKKKAYNEQLSLYITIGARVMKRFMDMKDKIAQSVIDDCARNSSSSIKREKLEKLLNENSF